MNHISPTMSTRNAICRDVSFYNHSFYNNSFSNDSYCRSPLFSGNVLMGAYKLPIHRHPIGRKLDVIALNSRFSGLTMRTITHVGAFGTEDTVP